MTKKIYLETLKSVLGHSILHYSYQHTVISIAMFPGIYVLFKQF